MDSSDGHPLSPTIPPTLHEPMAREAVGDLPQPFGRYHIVRKLGQGGMGAVYLAQDTQLDRPVALKVPNLSATDSQSIERFYREARAAATLDHPNLCPVFDVGEAAGRHYLTMAYIEGRTLAELIRGGPPLPPRPVADLVRKLALALQDAHAKGVVHRDLKPGNIIVNHRNEPVVLDFGLARLRTEDVRLTSPGTLMGTPAYMPPEQVRGDLDAVGPASDIYSLGVVLYELLTGKLPFTGDLTAVISQVLTREPVPITQHRSDIDPALEAICRKAMAKEPSQRFASMADFASALGAYLSGSPVSGVSTSPLHTDTAPLTSNSVPGAATQLIGDLVARLEASEARARKGSRWPWLVAALALLLAVVSVVAFLFFRQPPAAQMVVVYLNAPQLERAEPTLRFVLIAGQRIPREKLNEPIVIPAGTHTFSLEREDGKIVELGAFTVTPEDTEKAVEVTPEKGVSIVAKEEITRPAVDPPPLKPVVEGKEMNLAAAVNGGWLADAPAEYDPGWVARNLIDLPDNGQYAAPSKHPIAAVIGFQGGQVARIHRVGVNPASREAKPHWVRKVKVEVSETYPFAGFTEVGEFDVENSASDVSFDLPEPRTARYVRFTFLKNGGGSWIELSEVMVYGSLLAQASPPPSPLVNVALASAGGKVLRATSNYSNSHSADKLIDGVAADHWSSSDSKEQEVVLRLARSASVRYVTINPYSREDRSYWARQAEVFLAPPDRPTDFRSIGMLNLEQVGRDHALKLESPVTAEFVKVQFRNNHGGGGWIQAQEVKVLADATPDEDEIAFNGKNLTGWRLRNRVAIPATPGTWKIVGAVRLDQQDHQKLLSDPGTGVLLNPIGNRGFSLISEASHGDCELSLEFNIPKGSNSGVYVQGRYKIQIADNPGRKGKPLQPDDCGGIYNLVAPRSNASRPIGEWQTLRLVFRAPRFDSNGKKTASARFEKVILNGTVIHENIEIPRPTSSGLTLAEARTGPLMLQGDNGIVAFRNLRLKRLQEGE